MQFAKRYFNFYWYLNINNWTIGVCGFQLLYLSVVEINRIQNTRDQSVWINCCWLIFCNRRIPWKLHCFRQQPHTSSLEYNTSQVWLIHYADYLVGGFVVLECVQPCRSQRTWQHWVQGWKWKPCRLVVSCFMVNFRMGLRHLAVDVPSLLCFEPWFYELTPLLQDCVETTSSDEFPRSSSEERICLRLRRCKLANYHSKHSLVFWLACKMLTCYTVQRWTSWQRCLCSKLHTQSNLRQLQEQVCCVGHVRW